MSDDGKRSGGFWTSVPGVLAGLAAVVTAGTGAYLALHQPPAPSPQPTPASPSNEARPAPTPSPVVAPAPARFTGPMGQLEPGLSYSGGDMYDRPSSSAQQCVQICANDDRCRAVTFIISQQRCWVKDRINVPQPSSDMVSSRKQG